MLRTPSLMLVTLSLTSMLAACGGIRPRPLAPENLRRLAAIQSAPATAGDQIYVGRVYALDGRPEPLFRYDRRIQRTGNAVTSTHVTYDPTGAIVVVQSALHSPKYELQRADMIHGQTGASASVAVVNGEAIYTLHDGVHQTTSRERVGDPLVAGPTMFGYILAHWEELNRGMVLPIRFAVLERGESFGFTLDKVEAAQGQTIVRMKPTSPLVRLAVAPTYFHFDTNSRQIREYTGRVPPLEQIGNRLATLDARVTYSFVAPAFR